MNDEENTESIFFSPPLYRQRYMKVSKIIESFGKRKLTKLVDVGCSEMGFFPYLKRIQGIQNIVFLDVDESVLKQNCNQVDPLAMDFIEKRDEPLAISVVCEDAQNFRNIVSCSDIVTMIEFIEHLHEDALNRSIHSIFGAKFPPSLIVVTTPNSDFNQFFPSLPNGAFRHNDHKFEWSEQQFQSWCTSLVQNYPIYEVKYDGCGFKDGICCSQIAIFTKKDSCIDNIHEATTNIQHLSVNEDIKYMSKNKISSLSTLSTGLSINLPCNTSILHQVSYPFDSKTVEEKLRDSLKSTVGSLFLWLNNSVDNISYSAESPSEYHLLNHSLQMSSQNRVYTLALQHDIMRKNIWSKAAKNETPTFQLTQIRCNKTILSSDTEEYFIIHSSLDNENLPTNSSNGSVGHTSNIEPSLIPSDEGTLGTFSEGDYIKSHSSSFRLKYFTESFENVEDSLRELPANIFAFSELEDRILFTTQTFSNWSGLPYCEMGCKLAEDVLKELKVTELAVGDLKFFAYDLYGENYDESE